MQIRKLTKIEKQKCKRSTKIINLNKITQHKKVLLNYVVPAGGFIKG